MGRTQSASVDPQTPVLDSNPLNIVYQCKTMHNDVWHMITAPQLRAARALLGIDQITLAQRSTLSLPTIQRMEASGGLIRGNVDSLVKVIQALEDMGVELIGEGNTSTVGGRGVRLRERDVRTMVREQKLGTRQSAIP